MFRKLISNLPYHPAVLEQVSFYLHRVRQEESIRRIGFVITALVMIVQLFAIIYPSKPSLATSANDIIYGANSKDDVLRAYKNNRDTLGRTDIRAIYDHYGIGIEQISAAKPTRIGSTERDFISTGRSTSPGVDTFIRISGVADGGIYQRPLKNWDAINHQENWYNSITGMSSYGFRFWILTSGCGNIVFEQSTLPPNLDIIKQRTSSSTINPSDNVNYLIQFINNGPGTARSVKITDTLSKDLSYVSYTSNIDLKFSHKNQTLSWEIANSGSQLPASQRWYTINLTVKANTIGSTERVCNAADIIASSVATKTTNNPDSERCVKIIIPTCPGTGLPIPAGGVEQCQITCPDGSVVPYNKACTTPQLSCDSLKIIDSPSWDSRKFETTVIAQKGAVPKQINYFVNNHKVSSVAFSSGALSQFYSYTFPSVGTYDIRAELEASTGVVQPSQGCDISETITQPTTPQPRISTDKKVTNLTQHIDDANNTTAKPGDQLKYTIFVYNNGDAPAVNLALDGDYGESINDILEYSTLVDRGDATFNDQTNYLSWGDVTIPPGGMIQKSFTVQVKDPLPDTPASASDPLSYDFNMQNVYGNLVIVHLDKPASKVVEQTVNTLPNTGPGNSMFISFIAIVVVGYFFYRSRLMTKELEIVHQTYSSGGM